MEKRELSAGEIMVMRMIDTDICQMIIYFDQLYRAYKKKKISHKQHFGIKASDLIV